MFDAVLGLVKSLVDLVGEMYKTKNLDRQALIDEVRRATAEFELALAGLPDALRENDQKIDDLLRR